MKKPTFLSKLTCLLILLNIFVISLTNFPKLILKTSFQINLCKIKLTQASWSNATVISDGYNGTYWNTEFSGVPDLAIDNNGTIHVVWEDYTDGEWGTDSEIMYANYTYTMGWSNATVISDGYDCTNWNRGASGDPAIAIDNSGTLHVVWKDETNGTWGTDTEIMYVNYTATMGWSNATVISDGYSSNYWNTGESIYPDIAVDNTRTVHVVWYDTTTGEWGADPEIMYVNFTAATGWSNATVISDGYNGIYWNTGDSTVPALAVDEAGGVHVVWFDDTPGVWETDWEIMYANYTIAAGWSNATVISDGYQGNYWNTDDSAYPAIATNGSGQIHVVWTDFTAGIWGNDVEIMYAEYTDATGWSNATIISDGYNDSYWSTDSSAFPSIVVDNNGTIHVVYEEYTNGIWGWDTEIMYVNYTAASGWSNATVISDGYNGIYWNTGASFKPAIALNSLGPVYVHVVWYDQTEGVWGSDNEIMYAYIYPPALSAPKLQPLSSNGSQVFLNWTYVPRATIYYIYRNTTEITSTVQLTPIGTTTGNYSEDTVPTNGTYYYVIVAGHLFGNSSISNCENITISLVVDGSDDGTTSPPSAPKLQPLSSNGSQVFLNWTHAPSAMIYYVYRDTSEITSTAELTPIDTTTGNYSEDTVPTNGTYYYVIVAGNLYGNSSISNCENITISLVVDGPDDGATSPPSAPKLQPLSSNGFQVFLNWTYVPSATIYYVYRDTSEITSTAELTPIGMTTGNHSEDTIPTNGTYYYVIVAGNHYGNSSISNCENITISLVVDGPDDRANLTWVWYIIIPLLIVLVTFFLLKKLKSEKGQK